MSNAPQLDKNIKQVTSPFELKSFNYKWCADFQHETNFISC